MKNDLEGFPEVDKKQLSYPEPKTVIELIFNYQYIINLCQTEIQKLLHKNNEIH